MSLIYITGISGVGKSTATKELIERGYEAYDADKAVSAFYRRDTGATVAWEDVPTEPRPEDWERNHAWRMTRRLVEQLAEKAINKNVFLCGVAENDNEVWDLFDKVFALLIDDSTLRHRLATRTDNQFGKQPHQLVNILSWQKNAEKEYLKFGATIIDATQPLEKVVDEILNSTNEPT